MKRVLILFVISLFTIVLVSSCKTADCPAYSEIEVEQRAELPS